MNNCVFVFVCYAAVQRKNLRECITCPVARLQVRLCS